MENLKNIFKKYNISISESEEKKFQDFYNFLIEKNKVMNLTAITEWNDVLFKHFLDSVLPEKEFLKNSNVVDVGAGAGFPSIPLKIIRSDLNITMIDSLLKRVNFLNETIEKINLKNISAIHSRAEDFAKEKRESFDIATARAVAPLPTLLEYLLPLIKVGGLCIIYKSTKLEEELTLSQNAIKVLGAEIKDIKHFEITEQNFERNILILKKVKQTPKLYPRSKNAPKLKPL